MQQALPASVREAAVAAEDWAGLRDLPWGTPLEEWPEQQVDVIDQRRGMSRHPVLFVRAGNRKYAIKETSPEAAAAEIENYRAIARRGCPSLVPVGSVTVVGEPILAGSIGGGVAQYISGDVGYCITRLATRVLPHSLLYQYPFTAENKQILLVAIARLLVTLHDAGIYWGDPSLANVLVDLSRRRLLAVLADAETVQLYPESLREPLRQQDVEFFVEALSWQSEDIRLARNLPEAETVLNEDDTLFFIQTYETLRQHDRHALDIELALERLGSGVVSLGAGVLGLGAWALRASQAGVEVTRRPGWYRDQVRDLMGVWIPRTYARRVYDLLMGHKWLMSEAAGRDVGLGDAAADFRERYHDPLVRLLQTYNPGQSIDYVRYLAILHHIWRLSQRERRPIPIEEGAIDYLLPKAGPAV